MEFNKSKDKEYKLPCENCDNETYHKVLWSVETSESNEDMQIFSEFQIVICQGCKNISFRYNWQSTDDFYGDINNPQLIDHEELYPSRIAGRKELKDKYFLPAEIYRIYKETHSVLCGCGGMSILAGVGIRILVEAICNDKKANGNNLENKIDNLVEIGILTKEGAEILHGTRLLGNQAAHEAKLIGEQTLNEAMDVVEYLLTGAYILPKKTVNLPKRK